MGNPKRRLYDIDSNKKLLRKDNWDYIQDDIFSLSNIDKVEPLNNDIKNNTNWEFEKDFMDAPKEKLFEKHYNLKLERIL